VRRRLAWPGAVTSGAMIRVALALVGLFSALAPSEGYRVCVVMPLFFSPQWVEVTTAAIITVDMINQRDCSIVQGCDDMLPRDAQFDVSLFNTGFSDQAGLEAAYNCQELGGGVIIGCIASSCSTNVALLAKAFNIPVISPGSTSGVLSDPVLFPNFFRTIPVDTATSQAAVRLAAYLNAYRMCFIHPFGSYGVSFFEAFRVGLKELEGDHELIGLPYSEGDLSSMQNTMREAKSRGCYLINFVVLIDDVDAMFFSADEEGLIDASHAWIRLGERWSPSTAISISANGDRMRSLLDGIFMMHPTLPGMDVSSSLDDRVRAFTKEELEDVFINHRWNGKTNQQGPWGAGFNLTNILDFWCEVPCLLNKMSWVIGKTQYCLPN